MVLLAMKSRPKALMSVLKGEQERESIAPIWQESSFLCFKTKREGSLSRFGKKEFQQPGCRLELSFSQSLKHFYELRREINKFLRKVMSEIQYADVLSSVLQLFLLCRNFW